MLNKTLIVIRSFVVAVGATAASSFVGVFGVYLGASASEMGWLQSSANALSNGGQILWGRLSDRVGARRPFLIAGSLLLAVLWYLMSYSTSPVSLIIAYALISFFASLITVNWFSLIADQTDSSVRGRFLSVVNILSSVGTIISLILMTLFFTGAEKNDIFIPFSAAAGSYIISAVLMSMLRENKHEQKVVGNLRTTLRNLKRENHFYRYFLAMNIQGIFWSMAWPMFPITIVSVMDFSLTQVAYLTVASLAMTVAVQYVLGRLTDRINRPPVIFANRAMLSLIPLMYGFFTNFGQFIMLEIYSGFLGSIQNVVMNSYLLDIVPENHRAEYISIINGFNGLVYLIGALIGGYLLEWLLGMFHLRMALEIAYICVFAGRFLSSLLFLRLKEPGKRGKAPLGLYSQLFRLKQPGNPSGGTIRFR
ncbi:MFS transporter [Thermoplasmatales archaeon AK]|nr:MFS transporter [Thermoplasmatales archaeon AK]